MSTDDLREQLLQTLAQHDPENHDGLDAPWYYEPQADALMPIIAQAQVQAWDEGYVSGYHDRNREVRHGAEAATRDNPYTERTDR